MIDNKSNMRCNAFFEQLELSATTIQNYRAALNSKFLSDLLKESYGISSIFEIDNIERLWEIYTRVNLSQKNIDNHRAYSAPIMKYIRFLNGGEKYGRRIDYNKPKGKRK